MRIAYILNSLACCGGHKIALEHALLLGERGHVVDIVYINNDSHELEWFQQKDKIRFQGFKDIAQLEQYDVAVATYYLTVFSLLGMNGATRKHWFVQGDDRRNFVIRKRGSMERDLIHLLHQTNSVEIFTEASWLRAMFWNEFGRNVEVIPNKIDLATYYPEPGHSGRGSKPLVVVEGHASSPIKGIDLAVEALSPLNNCAKWLITSDTEKLPRLTRVFDRIIVRPTQTEMRRLLSDADVVVKASRYEGSPLPHLEAMACGAALVATRCRGVEEYCRHMDNAWIVPNENVPAIRRAVEFLIARPGVRRRLAERAAAFAAKELAWKDSIDRLERYYARGTAPSGGDLDEKSLKAIRKAGQRIGLCAFPWFQGAWRKARAASSPAGAARDTAAPGAASSLVETPNAMPVPFTTLQPVVKLPYTADITVETSTLSGISMYLGTHRRRPAGQVHVSLVDPSSNIVLRRATVRLEDVEDNSFVEFSFVRIHNVRGRRFRLRINMKSDGPISVYGPPRGGNSLGARIRRKLIGKSKAYLFLHP